MHQIQIGLAKCTPVPFVPGPAGPRLAMVTTEWHRAEKTLAMPTNFNIIEIYCDGMEVGEARNRAVADCMKHKPRPEFLFFLDYDVAPAFDAVTKLLFRARHFPDHDIFCGVYCCKSSIPEPLIYKGDGAGPFWDWAIGDLLTEGITGCHMGLTLIRMSLFDRVTDWEKPLFLTQNRKDVVDGAISTFRGTEDLYFCKRMIEECNAKILVDTSVLAGHIDHATGKVFGLPKDSMPVKRAIWLAMNNTGEPTEPKKLALDIGAGGTRREWPDHKTYTTDIRGDTKPDYVMDTRWLNLPDNHFDLVASSHHLEHLPRFEQETVWKEIFRVCKPGGRIEHIVPNLEWAGWKVADGQCDEHVFNVLYGAQEAHGYKAEYNTHFFGYTPEIGKALAEQAGFVNVETKSYKQHPELGYNLIITGEKPVFTPLPIEKPKNENGRAATVPATSLSGLTTCWPSTASMASWTLLSPSNPQNPPPQVAFIPAPPASPPTPLQQWMKANYKRYKPLIQAISEAHDDSPDFDGDEFCADLRRTLKRLMPVGLDDSTSVSDLVRECDRLCDEDDGQ